MRTEFGRTSIICDTSWKSQLFSEIILKPGFEKEGMSEADRFCLSVAKSHAKTRPTV
jgi:hypothetical protein